MVSGKDMGFNQRISVQLFHLRLLPVWSQASHFKSLGLSVFICKNGQSGLDGPLRPVPALNLESEELLENHTGFLVSKLTFLKSVKQGICFSSLMRLFTRFHLTLCLLLLLFSCVVTSDSVTSVGVSLVKPMPIRLPLFFFLSRDAKSHQILSRRWKNSLINFKLSFPEAESRGEESYQLDRIISKFCSD